ncbi:MAG: hypothetical protein WBP45_01025 [Daejeonella sp.]
MKTRIQNVNELRAEIARLKLQRLQYEHVFEAEIKNISDKLTAPIHFVKKIGAFFSGDNDHGKAEQIKGGTDWVSVVSRIGLPLILNKLVFRKSGFIMKSIVALISQKAATSVNKDLVVNWIDKAANWIKSSKFRKKQIKSPDYGIPPDSEAS